MATTPNELIRPMQRQTIRDSQAPLPEGHGSACAPAFPPGLPCAPVSASDLQDLVDRPRRALDVEIKSWRNLDNREDQAELARDIAALANSGGGWILLGFHEKTLAPADADPFRTEYTPARIAAIAEAWLDPPPRCEVAVARSAQGGTHPAIRVPPHGAVPVCIRRDGPAAGGRAVVAQGLCYIRRPGPVVHGTYIGSPAPESAPLVAAAEWAPLIRRCMRQEREALLGMIEAALEGRRQEPSTADRLHTWHDAARATFLALVPRSPVADSLAGRHYVLSYAFDFLRPEMLEHAQVPELLRRAVFDVQQTVRPGWNMFDPPCMGAVKPRFVVDPATGDAETDFLEVAWLRDAVPGETADFWRVCPSGRATVIRDYGEDNTELNRQLRTDPGSWFSPNRLAQEIAELLHHARAMARFFRAPRHVALRCEWWGLAGRSLFDPATQWARHAAAAADDHRIVTALVPVAMLSQAWPDVVSQVMAPVIRAFEPDLALGADWVRAQAPGWRGAS